MGVYWQVEAISLNMCAVAKAQATLWYQLTFAPGRLRLLLLKTQQHRCSHQKAVRRQPPLPWALRPLLLPLQLHLRLQLLMQPCLACRMLLPPQDVATVYGVRDPRAALLPLLQDWAPLLMQSQQWCYLGGQQHLSSR